MAGRPGRSGGHNRMSAAEHRLRGTFNRTRHGRQPPALTVLPMPAHDPVPPDLIEGLEGRGRTFIEECWRTYRGWTPATVALLREAGQLIERVEGLRGQRGEQPAQRLLLAVLSALNLEK